VRSHRPAAALAAAAVATTIVLAGCGSDGDSGQPAASPATSTTTDSPKATGSTAPTATGTTVEVAIANGKVTPDPSRRVEVKTGDQVHIRVTSDHADEVHVHGYDIEKEVGAGSTATIDFTANIPGQFEVEAHEVSPGLLFTLVVR
jgi:hypothetical protein